MGSTPSDREVVSPTEMVFEASVMSISLTDHGVVQLGGDGVDAADAVRAGDDLRRADAHSLCHALRRHGHDGGVIGQESHRGGACGLGGQDDGESCCAVPTVMVEA